MCLCVTNWQTYKLLTNKSADPQVVDNSNTKGYHASMLRYVRKYLLTFSQTHTSQILSVIFIIILIFVVTSLKCLFQ